MNSLESFQCPRTQHDKAFIIFKSPVQEANGKFNEKLLTYKAEASPTASRAVQARRNLKSSSNLDVLLHEKRLHQNFKRVFIRCLDKQQIRGSTERNSPKTPKRDSTSPNLLNSMAKLTRVCFSHVIHLRDVDVLAS
jgi:hypothetical protein